MASGGLTFGFSSSRPWEPRRLSAGELPARLPLPALRTPWQPLRRLHPAVGPAAAVAFGRISPRRRRPPLRPLPRIPPGRFARRPSAVFGEGAKWAREGRPPGVRPRVRRARQLSAPPLPLCSSRTGSTRLLGLFRGPGLLYRNRLLRRRRRRSASAEFWPAAALAGVRERLRLQRAGLRPGLRRLTGRVRESGLQGRGLAARDPCRLGLGAQPEIRRLQAARRGRWWPFGGGCGPERLLRAGSVRWRRGLF